MGKKRNQLKISLVSGIMLNSTTAPFNFFRLAKIFLQTWNWIATAPFSGVFGQSHHHWSTGGPPLVVHQPKLSLDHLCWQTWPGIDLKFAG